MSSSFWQSLPRQVWVFYHYPCNDGIFAATCAYLFFKKYSANVRFIPHKTYEAYSLEPKALEHVDTVFLLDYIGNGLVEELAKNTHTVIIDHHKTAISYLQTNPDQWSSYQIELYLDDQRSACGLAWNYFSNLSRHFFQQDLIDLQLAETHFLPILRAVQDADLWLWKEQGSKEIVSGLSQQLIEYDVNSNPQVFEELVHLTVDDLVSLGKLAIEENEKMILKELQNTFVIEPLPEHKFLAVMVDSHMARLRSELGNVLAKESEKCSLLPVAAVVYPIENKLKVEDTAMQVAL
ncbi:nucleic acid binding protein [Galdieria sulphuraria]|uniref:Nucleic acid binding protein n=1 Tax=Galdieria sulphuraria TaxID=130081 RepID=M2Y284_GALSU|nr:nucleic acid binding protein [Galdieria sulphuraria]EME29919.1 nucleic acid binding protein [Galdieria sulphuraria]|eukprot:XP_005706439.1 nucleic acid binding protein [Galdieria sulphuraria]